MLRDVERSRLSQGAFHLTKARLWWMGEHIHQGGWSGSFPFAEIGAWGSQGGPYWTSRAHMRSGYGGHMRGFIPQDGGSPSRVEAHGEVPRIKGIFDDSGSSIITVKNGFFRPD